MKRVLKLCIAIVVITSLNSCNEESINEDVIEKGYSYNIDDIYTIPSSLKSSKSNSISDVTYVIPTRYKNNNYNFEITTLSKDGKSFNIFFDNGDNSYSVNYLIDGDKIIPLAISSGITSKGEDSFGSCVGSHEGAGYALLTGACAGITSFIPFMQPIAFACAAETAVIASIIVADCAIN